LGTHKPIIKGRLKNHLEFWSSLHTPDWIMDILAYGVKVPFLTPPPPIFKTNNRSSVDTEHRAWVRNTLHKYLEYGFIEQVPIPPYCVMPLQVKVSTSKNSLIYDMTALTLILTAMELKEPFFFDR
jgi:hypothetical protein